MMPDDVLVVEDDPEINEMVGAYAQIAGFEYRRALTGTDALAEVSRRAPRVIILDVMLPEMDGYETMRAIRGRREFRSLPIIALTAKAMKGDREKCIEAGASDYISKPVDTDQLLSLLRVWLYK